MQILGATYWTHKTNTGVIVYKRKKHTITPVDVMRFARSMVVRDKKMAEVQIREIIFYLLDFVEDKDIRPTTDADLSDRWAMMLDGILQKLSSVLLLYVPTSALDAAKQMINSRLTPFTAGKPD